MSLCRRALGARTGLLRQLFRSCLGHSHETLPAEHGASLLESPASESVPTTCSGGTSGMCDWGVAFWKVCVDEVFRFASATRHIMPPHHIHRPFSPIYIVPSAPYTSSHQPFRPITATRQMMPSLHFLGQHHLNFATSLHEATLRFVTPWGNTTFHHFTP